MYDFDFAAERAGSDSVKWNAVTGEEIPMWVADMDLKSPEPILKAIMERAAHPYYGYPYTQDLLREVISGHYKRIYNIELNPEWIVWIPSVMPGLTAALQMMGGEFMYSVPMYNHIRMLSKESKLPVIEVPLKLDEDCRYTMDIDALEAAVTPEVKCLVLCNPHNPVGRVYTREELLELQAFCKKHNLLVLSDEIHCEFDFEDRHIPYFSLNEEAADYSITASSAGKICNIPGLPMGFAIVPNKELKEKLESQLDGLQSCANVITLAAYEKAYDGSCAQWKKELREYLKVNRDITEERLGKFTELKMPHNEGTYLLWIDCSGLGVKNPADFFLEKAKVKVCDGDIYGNVQFIRFNYACPRAQLMEALDKMERAIWELKRK